jgi:glutamate--cysteine ligase
MNAYLDAPKKGLETELEGKKLYQWGEIFFKMAKEGLTNRKQINSKNKDETIYLQHVENIIKNKKNRSQLLVEKYKKSGDLEFFNDEKENFSYSGF